MSKNTLAILAGCLISAAVLAQMIPSSTADNPDHIFYNAKILTVDQKFSVASAIAGQSQSKVRGKIAECKRNMRMVKLTHALFLGCDVTT